VGISGTTAAAGELTGASSRAHVFSRAGGGWVRRAAPNGADTSSNDGFGSSVAISGNTAVVGALFHSGHQATDRQSGRTNVFARQPTGWQRSASLNGATTGGNEEAGWSVADSGTTAIVGDVFERA